MTSFSAGAAQVDITPPLGLPMDGYIERVGVSRAVHDPLYAQILVLADESVRVAVVSLDIIAVSAEVTGTWQSALAPVVGTTPDSILICATHTHAGPAGLQTWFPVGANPALSPSLVSDIQNQLVKAAQSAVSRLCPARIVVGRTEINGVGSDRNAPLPSPDPTATTFRVDALDGHTIAVFVHYACHPTVLGPQLDYSADFPGALRNRIHVRHPEAICLFINGAAGNISTRFPRRAQTFEEVNRLGTLLGDQVLHSLDKGEESETGLAVSAAAVDLPVRDFSAFGPRTLEIVGNLRIDQTRAEGAAIERNLAVAFAGRAAVRASVSALHIGPWRLLSVPGEAFNELAAALHQVSDCALVAGYTNDYLGYFPTQKAIDAQTYEALSSPYDSRALTLIQTALSRLI